MSADSLKALVAGGIALGTPDPPGKEAPEGTTYRLYDKPDPQWSQWSPDLPLGFKDPVLKMVTAEQKHETH